MSEQLPAGYNSVKGIVFNSFYGPFFFQPFSNKVAAENTVKMAQINRITVIKIFMNIKSHMKLLKASISKYSFKGLGGGSLPPSCSLSLCLYLFISVISEEFEFP